MQRSSMYGIAMYLQCSTGCVQLDKITVYALCERERQTQAVMDFFNTITAEN